MTLISIVKFEEEIETLVSLALILVFSFLFFPYRRPAFLSMSHFHVRQFRDFFPFEY